MGCDNSRYGFSPLYCWILRIVRDQIPVLLMFCWDKDAYGLMYRIQVGSMDLREDLGHLVFAMDMVQCRIHDTNNVICLFCNGANFQIDLRFIYRECV